MIDPGQTQYTGKRGSDFGSCPVQTRVSRASTRSPTVISAGLTSTLSSPTPGWAALGTAPDSKAARADTSLKARAIEEGKPAEADFLRARFGGLALL